MVMKLLPSTRLLRDTRDCVHELAVRLGRVDKQLAAVIANPFGEEDSAAGVREGPAARRTSWPLI